MKTPIRQKYLFYISCSYFFSPAHRPEELCTSQPPSTLDYREYYVKQFSSCLKSSKRLGFKIEYIFLLLFLIGHIKRRHEDPNLHRTFLCHQCEKGFFSAFDLKQHILTHFYVKQ